jgi:hypothetical protein
MTAAKARAKAVRMPPIRSNSGTNRGAAETRAGPPIPFEF